MWVSDGWKEYELLDAAGGMRLERWGRYILSRPDPQVIWKTPRTGGEWYRADAVYTRDSSGGGSWSKHGLSERWEISYKDMTFLVKPMNFKHTGLFPEQAANWDTSAGLIEKIGHGLRLLNLFAYTGAATVAAAKAGAFVTHVDSAKGMVAWARENAARNGVEARFLVDDCVKFVRREIRRGNKYDAIIMDPPSYGRGPGGEVWKFEDDLYDFLVLCEQLLSGDAAFVFINAYTTGLAPAALTYLLQTVFAPHRGGNSEAGELGLPVVQSGLILPCGATGRWIRC